MHDKIHIMRPSRSIFEYENFRAFLKDCYSFSKARNKKFSFRYFARIAGFKSPSFLKLVMEGEANLSRKSIPKVAAALKLSKEEAEFFKNLVLFEQATSTEEKHAYSAKIMRSHRFKRIHPISEAQFNYYSNWYYIPVRELVGMPGFKEDPAWIAKKFDPPITEQNVKKALNELQKLGLIIRDAEGRLTTAHSNINTANEVTSQTIAQYHREMMRLAAESIDRFPRTRREISSITMGVSEGTANLIKKRVQEFRAELANLIAQDSEGVDRVYQLNFQFFPMVCTADEKAEGDPE
jgi:uncharacterized protein (TIGR02147 family)